MRPASWRGDSPSASRQTRMSNSVAVFHAPALVRNRSRMFSLLGKYVPLLTDPVATGTSVASLISPRLFQASVVSLGRNSTVARRLRAAMFLTPLTTTAPFLLEY